jgi:hypothetical protein
MKEEISRSGPRSRDDGRSARSLVLAGRALPPETTLTAPAKGSLKEKIFDEQSAANGDYPSP